MDKDNIFKEILNQEASNVCRDSDIPSRIFKKNANILQIVFTPALIIQYVSVKLKLFYFTTVFKKSSRNSRDNHRPVSILSNISKPFERHMLFFSFYVLISGEVKIWVKKRLQEMYLLIMLEKWKNKYLNVSPLKFN